MGDITTSLASFSGIPGMQSLGMSKDSKGATPTSMEGIFKSLMGGQPGQGGSEQQMMMGLLGMLSGGSLGAGQQGMGSPVSSLLSTASGAGVAKLPDDNSIQNNKLQKAKQAYLEAEQEYQHAKVIFLNFDQVSRMSGKKDFSGVQNTELREALQYFESDGVKDEYMGAAARGKSGAAASVAIVHFNSGKEIGILDARTMLEKKEDQMNRKKAEYEKLLAESNKKAPNKLPGKD